MRFIIPLAVLIYVLLNGPLTDEHVPVDEQEQVMEAVEDSGGMIIEEDFEIELGENEFG